MYIDDGKRHEQNAKKKQDTQIVKEEWEWTLDGILEEGKNDSTLNIPANTKELKSNDKTMGRGRW